jgi:hypothetical protein
MDALYPPLFAVGDQVTITETGQSGVVIHNEWRYDEWRVLVDRPHTGGSSIRQTFSQSALSEWMPK